MLKLLASYILIIILLLNMHMFFINEESLIFLVLCIFFFFITINLNKYLRFYILKKVGSIYLSFFYLLKTNSILLKNVLNVLEANTEYITYMLYVSYLNLAYNKISSFYSSELIRYIMVSYMNVKKTIYQFFLIRSIHFAIKNLPHNNPSSRKMRFFFSIINLERKIKRFLIKGKGH